MTRSCPKCGHICKIISFNGITFGYRCNECGHEFGIFKVMVGWKE